MKNKHTFSAAALAAVLLFLLFTPSCAPREVPPAGEDEIKLCIRLNLGEDIGLLLIDSDIDGIHTGGGISNADRTLLRHDETLWWSIDRQNYENAPDTVTLKLRFTVVTEYCDPNYENIYPEELQIPLDELTLSARFGEIYSIRIEGNTRSGYRCVLPGR